MLYEYQWSEDGETEYGMIEKSVSKEETSCYHCGCCINKNQNITLFTCDETYIICQKCTSTLFKE